MSDTEERRPKRQKRELSKKSKFDKLKEVKSGVRNKYEVEEVDNVYDTVDEQDYVKKVLDRQADDWVVEDDWSGYYDDGREIFDDDLDDVSMSAANRETKKGTKRKKKAVSDHVPKGDLKLMLSKMPTKKKEEETVSDDTALSDLLGEIDNKNAGAPGVSIPNVSLKSLLNEKKAEKDYLKTFTPPPRKIFLKKKLQQRKSLNALPKSVMSDEESENMEVEDSTSTPQLAAETERSTEESTIEETTVETQDDFEDGLDFSHIDELESMQPVGVENEEDADDHLLSAFLDQQEDFEVDAETSVISNVNTSELPTVDTDGKQVFRFFYWDAYENVFVQPGVVFLFGKTFCEKTKSFISCSVIVKDVQRKLYVLPRSHFLDESGKPTDRPISHKDVYDEFNQKVMKPLHVSCFKCRFVNKKNCFVQGIPVESDYMEVRYSAKDPPITTFEGKTFSHVFGVQTNYLEIFLLERKIKGPCWLDVRNPIHVTNPVTWCKFEVEVPSCTMVGFAQFEEKKTPPPPPPLSVVVLGMRFATNPKNSTNEIVMISCLVQNSYALDKARPNPPFQNDFCVFTTPQQMITVPPDIYKTLKTFKRTKVQKMDSEKALLNFFINQLNNIDPDLIVGHDLMGYQLSVLADRLYTHNVKVFSKLGRIRRANLHQKIERILFTGRLVCDIKISAKEAIKSRSYDLGTLCKTVLNFRENQRIELESEDVVKMYATTDNILKLIVLTMNDATYIMSIFYQLNIVPLALQITNIAGNIMSRTLTGGRSERNEFLLLHAFSEKDYIVPEKAQKQEKKATASKRKPAYAGGLVLEPKVGFYDKLILLMDFNSLYPSIIQEYNVCFTTLAADEESNTEIALPDKSLPVGVLPTEIRKLVESRREVKKLMKGLDKRNEVYQQYDIRQMALKLTANSMYGCLGFSNSRFYARNLAALVTQKGREILTNTRDLVQKMSYEVVYGDTDSIMINTNIVDIDQVNKIGTKIKQEVNKLYQQVELDIDGVFKYLLLLKKKKYAAMTITKTDDGKLKLDKEYKGLDIVRRDWSQIACETGKIVLDQILSDLAPDERIENIHNYLRKIRNDFETNKIPLTMLVITKQLTKDPKSYTDKNAQPHVQVALRYNQTAGGHFRAGDVVPYVICEDGSSGTAVQRAYHLDELKTSETLKIDVKYYLSQQIHPVVSRICEPIEGTDSFQIADCLGLDTSSFKKPVTTTNSNDNAITKPEMKFKNVDNFSFDCFSCRKEIKVDGPFKGNTPVFEKCPHCNISMLDHIPFIQNRLTLVIKQYIQKYNENLMICEDPACDNETSRIPGKFAGKYPVCTLCENGIMYKKYTESDLYFQISYFRHIFDPSKSGKSISISQAVEEGFHALRQTVEKYLNHSAYSVVNLTELFSGFLLKDPKRSQESDTDFTEAEEDADEI